MVFHWKSTFHDFPQWFFVITSNHAHFHIFLLLSCFRMQAREAMGDRSSAAATLLFSRLYQVKQGNCICQGPHGLGNLWLGATRSTVPPDSTCKSVEAKVYCWVAIQERKPLDKQCVWRASWGTGIHAQKWLLTLRKRFAIFVHSYNALFLFTAYSNEPGAALIWQSMLMLIPFVAKHLFKSSSLKNPKQGKFNQPTLL